MANLWDNIMNMLVEANPNTPNAEELKEGSGTRPKFAQATGQKNAPSTIRYKPKFDVVLLREVLARNPFEDGDQWHSIANNFNAALQNMQAGAVKVNERSFKERFDRLIKSFKSEELASLRRSGTAEEYEEREVLLTEISQLMSETPDKRKSTSAKNKKEQDLVAAGCHIRKRAMETLIPDNMNNDENRARTPKKSKKNQIATDYNEMKREEMELKRTELKLQREQFEMDRREREHRMEREKAKDELFMNLVKGLMEGQKK